MNFAKSKNIDLSAYCSIARGKILEISTLNNIAIKHNISIAQVAQHWAYRKGVIVNSMSTNLNNINDNFNILNFELSSEEMEQLVFVDGQNRFVAGVDQIEKLVHGAAGFAIHPVAVFGDEFLVIE